MKKFPLDSSTWMASPNFSNSPNSSSSVRAQTSTRQPPVTPDVTQPGTVGVQVCGTGRPAPGCRQLPPGPVTQTNVGDGWVGSVVGTPEPAVDGCGTGDVDGCGRGDVDDGCGAGDVDGWGAGDVDGCVPTVVA